MEDMYWRDSRSTQSTHVHTHLFQTVWCVVVVASMIGDHGNLYTTTKFKLIFQQGSWEPTSTSLFFDTRYRFITSARPGWCSASENICIAGRFGQGWLLWELSKSQLTVTLCIPASYNQTWWVLIDDIENSNNLSDSSTRLAWYYNKRRVLFDITPPLQDNLQHPFRLIQTHWGRFFKSKWGWLPILWDDE